MQTATAGTVVENTQCASCFTVITVVIMILDGYLSIMLMDWFVMLGQSPIQTKLWRIDLVHDTERRSIALVYPLRTS